MDLIQSSHISIYCMWGAQKTHIHVELRTVQDLWLACCGRFNSRQSENGLSTKRSGEKAVQFWENVCRYGTRQDYSAAAAAASRLEVSSSVSSLSFPVAFKGCWHQPPTWFWPKLPRSWLVTESNPIFGEPSKTLFRGRLPKWMNDIWNLRYPSNPSLAATPAALLQPTQLHRYAPLVSDSATHTHTHTCKRLFIPVTSHTDPWQFYFGPAAELIRPQGQEMRENNWCWCTCCYCWHGLVGYAVKTEQNEDPQCVEFLKKQMNARVWIFFA